MTGPARVTFNVPVDCTARGARRVEGEPGDAVVLCPGTVLEVRP